MGSLRGQHPAPVSTLGVLGNARHLLLETEATDGARHRSALRFAIDGDAALMRVPTGVAVLEAIRRQPIVKVGACTRRGKPLDGYIECMAQIVPPEEEAHADAALRRSYRPLPRLFDSFVRDQQAYLELTPIDLMRAAAQGGGRPRDGLSGTSPSGC